jgi:hypothetical protein
MPNRTLTTLASVAVVFLAATPTIQGANHREAPITALDHKADITDVYAFVSYDSADKVTLIMNVDPLLEPSNGPTYFPFDPGLVYRINIDNNHDARRDLFFEFRFKTEIRNPNLFTVAAGAGSGVPAPANSPPPIAPGSPIVPPAITALDGPGSKGLNLRQQYQVRLVRKGRGASRLGGDRTLFAVPTNVGARTMPDYPSLARQGVYDVGQGIRTFAGTVEDPFWIDLGATFDSLNFRSGASAVGVPGILDDTQDADDESNFAPDDIAGFNVNGIAIEVPIELLTSDGRRHAAGDPEATIGVWGETSRPQVRTLSSNRPPRFQGRAVQIQRMGNPLFNELLIGVGFKDKFSRGVPRADARFANFALDPVLARVLNAIYEDALGPGALPIPEPPRADLLPLVQYVAPIAAPGTPPGPIADLLRLNTGVPPTAASKRSRLGFLTLLDGDTANDDPAGFPNGRRVSDDVVDIATRVIAGVLAGPSFNRFPHNRIGDGVNANDAPYQETFPYLGYAHSGLESRHLDPGEPGPDGIPLAE